MLEAHRDSHDQACCGRAVSTPLFSCRPPLAPAAAHDQAREALGPDPHLGHVLLHVDPSTSSCTIRSCSAGNSSFQAVAKSASRLRDLALGDVVRAYYQHAVEIEVYVEEGDAAVRDAAFDGLLQQIGAALEIDPTLGGVAFGLTYGRPESAIEAIAGAPAIKSATLTVTIDYATDTPLS